jgi:hypothetical protein
MTDDVRFSTIEERLQAEAGQLLYQADGLSRKQLWTEYRRRRHARMQRAAASVGLLLVTSAIIAWTGHVPTPRPNERTSIALADHKSTVNPRRSTTPVRSDVQVPADHASRETLIVVPFLIDDPASGEVISGIYVPEQVEPIDWRRLSPAERHAVGAVLEIDDGLDDGEVI